MSSLLKTLNPKSYGRYFYNNRKEGRILKNVVFSMRSLSRITVLPICNLLCKIEYLKLLD